MKRFEPCYMCKNRANSDEHVPPKSFFPEGRRNGLITVPSCSFHNSAKSGNDEYLRLVFASLISGNEIARNEVWPKVMRSLAKAPRKAGLFRNLRPFKIGKLETGIFDADIGRFFRAMDPICRGLYFSIFGNAWLEPVYVFPPAAGFLDTRNPNDNVMRMRFEKGFNHWFGGIQKIGLNPEIFYLQYFGDVKGGVMKQVYFGGVTVLTAFDIKNLGEVPARLQMATQINPKLEDPNSASEMMNIMYQNFPGRLVGKSTRDKEARRGG